jgi:hypothetical protein
MHVLAGIDGKLGRAKKHAASEVRAVQVSDRAGRETTGAIWQRILQTWHDPILPADSFVLLGLRLSTKASRDFRGTVVLVSPSARRPGTSDYRAEGTGMIGYTAVGLSVVGFVVGLTLRFRALLIFVGLVLIASIVYSVEAGFDFLSTLLNIMTAEAILQGSYFAGLAARTFFWRNGLWSTL